MDEPPFQRGGDAGRDLALAARLTTRAPPPRVIQPLVGECAGRHEQTQGRIALRASPATSGEGSFNTARCGGTTRGGTGGGVVTVATGGALIGQSEGTQAGMEARIPPPRLPKP